MMPIHATKRSALSFIAIALAVLLGCSGSDDSNFNLRGNVTLDDAIIQGVTIQVEDDAGNEAQTMTDVRGAYGFVVVPGEKTVSIVSGIPGNAQCTPGVEQDVTVPVDGTVDADFACETPGGGMGGAGGMAGMGGMGGAGGGSGGGPFATCMERAPGDTACACDPLASNCSGNTKCSTNFFFDPSTGAITAFPALDGSDGSPATECIFDELKFVEEGGACLIFAVGPQRRDDCDEGLHCEQFAQDDLRCVPFCIVGVPGCVSGGCVAFGLTNPGLGEVGRCL